MAGKFFKKTLCILTAATIIGSSLNVWATENEIYDEDFIEANTICEDMVTEDFASLNSEPQKLIYSKYTFSDSADNDTAVGKMVYYNSTGGDDNALVRVNPDENNGCSWMSPLNFDSVGVHTIYNDVPCYFTTKYIRNGGKGSASAGYIYMCAGDDITPEDKSFTIEIEALDNNKANLTLRYVVSNEKNYKTISKARSNTGEWKTFTYEINDAYFNGDASTGLANGTADFRIEASSADTYVKSVTLYNSKDYEALYGGLDLLTLPTDTSCVEENFALPCPEGFEIQWSSNDESIVYIEDGKAVILPDFTEKSATLTAKLIKDGYYVEKAFDITLKPIEKKALEFSSFDIITNSDSASVGVDISNGRSYRGKITLFAIATDKKSGAIKEISMDSFVGGTANEARLDATVSLNSNLEFRYCMLDSKGASLRNNPPSKPANLRYNVGFDKIDLLWDKSFDDYEEVKGYEIFLDDELLAETKSELCTSVENLIPGERYSFKVASYDHMGEKSEYALLDMTMPHSASIETGDTDNGNGLSMLVNDNIGGGDSYSESAEINGVKCRKNVDRTAINGKSRTWLYFKTDKDMISTDDRKITLEITYLDRKGKNLVLQYNSADGQAAKNIVLVNSFGDTDEWKTITVTIEDAMFCEHSSLTKCDFRLGSNQAGGEVYIAKVRAIAG